MVTILASETITESIETMRAAEENILVDGQVVRVEGFEQRVNSVLNCVHVFDGRLDGREDGGDRA